MAPRKPANKSSDTAKATSKASDAGVVKRKYKRVRFLENGLIDVERKAGKFVKIAKQSQRDSPLLRLPPEIRNTIFEYALGGRTILLESTPFKYGDLKAVSLLAVSRQIYAETAMILFSANTFSASNPKSMALFLREQASTSVVRVTTVQVQCNVIVCDPRLFPELKQYAYIEKSFEQFDLKMPHLRRITFLPHIDDRTNGWDSSEIRIEVEACLERLAQRAKSKNPNLLVMVGKISSTKGPLVA